MGLVLVALVALSIGARAEDGIHKLALQISDNDPAKMTEVLNVAANVSRHYSGIGEQVDIKIIAFAGGLHMLRTDTSPVSERMISFAQSMPNVVFDACENTITSMERKEGKPIPLFEGVEIVPAGVVTLMELDEAGYTIVRP
jgi:intracellular sulfur oxidation DsrE/DsrF family protein